MRERAETLLLGRLPREELQALMEKVGGRARLGGGRRLEAIGGGQARGFGGGGSWPGWSFRHS